MNNIIYAAVYFGVTLAAFMLGKYVFPKVPQNVTNKLASLSAWAAEFVVWAREFKKSQTGEEKMEAVVEKLKEIAEEMGINVTEDQLKAIAQSAYESMKAGEMAAAPLEAVAAVPAATVVINTTGTVATATDNVPADVLEENPDGTVNVYDADGNKVGTVSAEEAEKAASNVGVIITEENG